MNEIDAYIKGFPDEVQERLTAIREIVRALAPQATERICMRIPTYDLNGKWLVHFAGFTKHIGFYPQPEGIVAFQEKLTEYKTTKGAVQFPLDKPLPLALIREIIQYRVAEQSEELSQEKPADSNKRTVAVPEELVNLLKNEAEATAFFESLSDGYKRGYCDWVGGAKQQATRETRAAKALIMLMNKQKTLKT